MAHAEYSVPPNDGYVTDTMNLLTTEQKQTLETNLGEYKRTTSNEIAVVILQNLEGQAIEDVGLEIGRKWGVGSQGKNNGILFLVAYDERSVRIDVGYGLEGAVPDIVAKGIIDADIVPHFRDGDYYGGITAAIESLKKHIGGEYTADRYAKQDTGGGFLAYLIFFVFILFQWVLVALSRTKSWWLGGVFGGIGGIVLTVIFGWWLSIPLLVLFGLFLDFIVSKHPPRRGGKGGGWWIGGSGFGGGTGGGGFGGFGGGSFGGGGASGRW
jgi:uncharacterized protein